MTLGLTLDNARILVVDDEPQVCRFLARVIQSLGYEVEALGNASDALERLLTGEFALVLSDIRMPVRGGLWLLEQLVEAGSNVAVIMVTADDDIHTAVDCLTRGASNYLVKPVNREELRQVIARALEERRLRLENEAYRLHLEHMVRERTAELEHANRALEAAYRESLYRLAAAAEYRDQETGNHIHRIGVYSYLIGKGMALDDGFVDLLLMASPMHDVGKIGIRDSILLKPGPLTEAEFEDMKAHTVIGARILGGSESPLLQLAEEIALMHHEKYDGSGYPRGLCGDDISLAGRIVAIADVFDALTSRRVYRPPFETDEALLILRHNMSGQFDPEVMSAFTEQLDEMLMVKRMYDDGRPR